MRFRRSALGIAFCLACVAAPAAADWPVARHDPARTAATGGKSDILEPVPYWRAYLGGTLRAEQVLAGDVDGNGAPDVVYVVSGRVFAYTAAGALIWQAAPTGIAELLGVDDFDGDGTLDVVGAGTTGMVLFSGKTGAIEWTEPAGEIGTLGATRIGDVDGDKKADLVIQECGYCGLASGKTGFVYSFAGGFAAPKLLWSLPGFAYRSLTLLDVDGDGTSEVSVGDATGFIYLLDGKTGSILAKTASMGTYIYFAACVPVDADGAKGDELLCYNDFVPATGLAHRLFLVKYDATVTPATYGVVWEKGVGDVDGGIRVAPELVVDLDGDGKKEVVASGTLTSGAKKTFVYDAALGTELATITDATVVGLPQVVADGKSVILTSSAAGALNGHTFVRATGTTALFSLPSTQPVVGLDPARRKVGQIQARVVIANIDADTVPDLLVFRGLPIDEIAAYAVKATPSLLASYKLPKATSTDTVVAFPGTAGFTAAGNNGTLMFLDAKLAPTSAKPVAFGGYYASGGWRGLGGSPVIGSLDGTATQSIVVPDSRGALLRLDAKAATFASPPRVVWERASATAPAIVPGLDGGTKPGVACVSVVLPMTSPPTMQVTALKADGTSLWGTPFTGIAFGDVLPAKVDADAIPDLVLQFGNQTDTLITTRAFGGKDGVALWTAIPLDAGPARQPAGFSVGDWNKDGKDDVVYQALATRVLSGVGGAEIATGGAADPYYLPVLSDVDADGKLEVALTGGFRSARLYDDDLTTELWAGTEDDRPYPYAAIATCGAGKGPVLAEGGWATIGRLKLTTMIGAGAGTSSSVILAGGSLFATEAAATAAGKKMGQLTSATVHADLAGTGDPIVLVGSSDGWLYGVKACTGTLAFARDFGAPVGEPILGDTDGDGKDEVLVSVGDGYLYDLRNDVLPAPTAVEDLDPAHGKTTTDIDETESTTSLTGKWVAVTGADKYEVAAVGPDGAYLTTPPWKDVGNVTQVTIDKLALAIGTKYTFAVRAVSTTRGTSPDSLSDGVVVVAPGETGPDAGETGPDSGETGPDAGDGGKTDAGPDATDDAGDAAPGGDVVEGDGCGCRTVGGASTTSLAGLGLGLLSFLGAAMRRGRRRAIAPR
jgi:hypothetical protein